MYDMLKGLSHDISIEDTRLIYKSGGKRFYDRREGTETLGILGEVMCI